MKVLFNWNLIEKDSFVIPTEDRAFRYGDGIFETIFVKNGEPKLLTYHINRIKKGLQFLEIDNEGIDVPGIEQAIKKLLDANGLNNNARVRLTVWRKEGGLFTPAETGYHSLISAHLLKNDYEMLGTVKTVGLSEKVKNQHYTLSAFKTLSSAHYVLAGLEKKSNNWDDIIILSDKGYISEGLQSNIFFVKNTFFLTPSLDTGCVDGVMRKHLLNYLSDKSVRTGEVFFTVEDMMEAEQIFICNAMGIRFIKEANGKSFDVSLPKVLEKFIEEY